tara:strand:- start:398 stop:610 length:213 start_codon:yes stop_codon:yes gene_type:complete
MNYNSITSFDKQIQELNHQDDLNRLAKQRNDKELDECCDTCKMYIGIIVMCITIVLFISFIVSLLIGLGK